MVTIVDPHIMVDTGYSVHQDAKRLGLFVKDENGNDFEGWCWPGTSSWVDFTSPDARQWWADRFSFDHYKVGAARWLPPSPSPPPGRGVAPPREPRGVVRPLHRR